MRRVFHLLVIVAVASGCARKKPPLPLLAPSATAKSMPGVPGDFGSAAAQPAFAVPQWGEKLLQTHDNLARYQAGVVLRDLGEAGYPALRAGLRNDAVEVRLTALQSISRPVLSAHKAETGPLLVKLLSDSNAAIRLHAASRLAWLGVDGKAGLTDLKKLADGDPDPDVRTAASEAARDIDIAITGKIPDYKNAGKK